MGPRGMWVVQEDDNETLTERVPIVLAGAQCEGAEATLTSCSGVELGLVGSRCRHESDVHVVCYNGPSSAPPWPIHALSPCLLYVSRSAALSKILGWFNSMHWKVLRLLSVSGMVNWPA